MKVFPNPLQYSPHSQLCPLGPWANSAGLMNTLDVLMCLEGNSLVCSRFTATHLLFISRASQGGPGGQQGRPEVTLAGKGLTLRREDIT